mmetsp:Transcript_19495/g.56604  ORF Transcript_19495/g.56604 Transcript_19495/m.56604 type:complete len:287 (-) Transcript_19495:471-1331(-)
MVPSAASSLLAALILGAALRGGGSDRRGVSLGDGRSLETEDGGEAGAARANASEDALGAGLEVLLAAEAASFPSCAYAKACADTPSSFRCPSHADYVEAQDRPTRSPTFGRRWPRSPTGSTTLGPGRWLASRDELRLGGRERRQFRGELQVPPTRRHLHQAGGGELDHVRAHLLQHGLCVGRLPQQADFDRAPVRLPRCPPGLRLEDENLLVFQQVPGVQQVPREVQCRHCHRALPGRRAGEPRHGVREQPPLRRLRLPFQGRLPLHLWDPWRHPGPAAEAEESHQ